MSDNNRNTRLADGADDDLEIAEPEDFEIDRDGDEILPVKQRIPGTDKAILVKPMPPGPFNRWQDVLEGRDETTEKQAEVLSEWIVEGPGADATPEYIEKGLRGGVLAGLLRAIRNAAGHEVLKGNREQELEEVGAMLEHMDQDQLQGLAAFGTSDQDNDA